MVRPAVADVPILAFGRYAEIVSAGTYWGFPKS
jgi:hypothetical protein